MSRLYGAASPAFSATVSGFLFEDSLANATATLALATPATRRSAVGPVCGDERAGRGRLRSDQQLSAGCPSTRRPAGHGRPVSRVSTARPAAFCDGG